MPSFDVVSEIDQHELTNAVDQTNREVGNRFDFKGSNSRVERGDGVLNIESQSDFQIKQIVDVLHQKMVKRGLDIRSLVEAEVELRGSRAYLTITVNEGIKKDLARKIVKMVKERKMKVQAAIQGEQVRITGKKRDDLQQAIAMLKESDIDQPLQFNNFRD
ncbi:MAG TPA: YajQ family cyclic di-GMP-binding protein [Ectothiorhodospiraceae bacterium]|nr:YajQ family cyclic di-GMP-binding protein [Ectothiorhodospiraceae bacterium]